MYKFKIDSNTVATIYISFSTLKGETFISGAVYSNKHYNNVENLDGSMCLLYDADVVERLGETCLEDREFAEKQEILFFCRRLLKEVYRKDKPSPTQSRRRENIFSRPTLCRDNSDFRVKLGVKEKLNDRVTPEYKKAFIANFGGNRR